MHRRYAQLICSVITLQGGSDWGVGGGGENMMVHDVNHMRTEMIGKAKILCFLHYVDTLHYLSLFWYFTHLRYYETEE